MKDRNSIDEKARALFERASHRLDLATANRLRQSRRLTLSKPSRRTRRLLPLAAAASLLVLGLAWWLPQRPPTVVAASTPGAPDVALIATDEDSDIYSWLGDAPVAPDDNAGGAL